MVGIIIRCMDDFLLSVLRGRELVSLVRYFDGTVDDGLQPKISPTISFSGMYKK